MSAIPCSARKTSSGTSNESFVNERPKKNTRYVPSRDSTREILRMNQQAARDYQSKQPDYMEDAIQTLKNSKPPSRKVIAFW